MTTTLLYSNVPAKDRPSAFDPIESVFSYRGIVDSAFFDTLRSCPGAAIPPYARAAQAMSADGLAAGMFVSESSAGPEFIRSAAEIAARDFG